MFLKAKHNWLINKFFEVYTHWALKRHFKRVNIVSDYTLCDKPLLVLANHISWWDGFWIFYLNMHLFRKKFHFMMLESQLRRYWVFNYCGGFSVNPTSRSVIDTINYTCELLRNTNNMVLIFPQGALNSIYNNRIEFKKGVERIISGVEHLQIVAVVNLLDYWDNKKPTLTIYTRNLSIDNKTIEDINIAYQEFFDQCIDQQKQIKV